MQRCLPRCAIIYFFRFFAADAAPLSCHYFHYAFIITPHCFSLHYTMPYLPFSEDSTLMLNMYNRLHVIVMNGAASRYRPEF